jgi:hypothetical protein
MIVTQSAGSGSPLYVAESVGVNLRPHNVQRM